MAATLATAREGVQPAGGSWPEGGIFEAGSTWLEKGGREGTEVGKAERKR